LSACDGCRDKKKFFVSLMITHAGCCSGGSTKPTRLPKVIWEQAASPSIVHADPLVDAAHNRSTVFARWHQCAHSSNTPNCVQPILTILNDWFSRFGTADAAFSLYVALWRQGQFYQLHFEWGQWGAGVSKGCRSPKNFCR